MGADKEIMEKLQKLQNQKVAHFVFDPLKIGAHDLAYSVSWVALTADGIVIDRGEEAVDPDREQIEGMSSLEDDLAGKTPYSLAIQKYAIEGVESHIGTDFLEKNFPHITLPHVFQPITAQ